MKKKITAFSILLLLLGFFTFNFVQVRADSGWDSDYDFGGSDWGSSDWGSDWGSSSYDYDWGSSSYSGSSGGGAVSSLIIWIIIFIIIAIIVAKKDISTGPTKYQGNSEIDNSIDEDEIKKHIPEFNKSEFLDKAYNTFIDVQNAWSEFDYDKLRSLLSDELYNTYHTQLIALKAKKQKNIMNNFQLKKIDITNVKVDGNKIALTVSLVVKFRDYVVDKNNTVVRGTDKYQLQNSYDLTFISTINKKKKDKVCPSCGAPLKNTSSNKCPYCGSNVIFDDYDWILSKKEIRRFY